MIIDLFAGAGGLGAGLLILVLALIVALQRPARAVMPWLPATIWALRVPRDSPHYRCPRVPDQRPAVSGLSKRRER